MADPTPTPDPTPDPAPSSTDPQPTPGTPPAPTDAPADDKAGAKGDKEAILGDLARERDKRQALETSVTQMQEAQQQQMDAIAKALGLKQDDEPADPAALTAQIETEKAAAREARLHLAVYQAAGTAGADGARLLDSASFLRSIAEVDPTDAAAVDAAIKQAVDANEAFKVAAPVPSFNGGARTTPAPQGTGTLGAALQNRIAGTTR